MAAERARAIPALKADDVISPDRASDRHRRLRRGLHWGSQSETGKRAMHLDNQSRQLVGPDLVMTHIAADDLRDLTGINAGRPILSCHLCAPCLFALAVFVELTSKAALSLLRRSFTKPNFLETRPRRRPRAMSS